MTDLDTIIENAVLDRPTSADPKLPQRPGLWRLVSLLAVGAALVITAISILQARNASDIPVPERDPVALESATVTVSGLALAGGGRVAVLGLGESESSREADTTGTRIDIPADMASVVAATSNQGDLVGLAVVRNDQDRSGDIEISAASTAQALVLLSPAILRPNLEESFANLGVIEADPAFQLLVQALQTNSNLSTDNQAVEEAFAQIVDRVPARRPAADQGCDSVVDSAAYNAAGTCVQPTTTGLMVTNEQDRWALIFSGTQGYADVCAAVSPTAIEGAEVLLPSEQCIGNSLLVAPGPVPLDNNNDDVILDRVRTATAVTMFYEYVAPFADLAGGSAGFTSESVRHIRLNTAAIVDTIDFVMASNQEFVAALDVPRDASTALDRHTADVAVARHLIEASNTTALIPQRALGDDAHVDILDFYTRAGERMVAPGTDWRWEVRAVDLVDFGADA